MHDIYINEVFNYNRGQNKTLPKPSYVVNFKQILFKDLLQTSVEEPSQLESCLFTCYCYEDQVFFNLVDKGVKVLVINNSESGKEEVLEKLYEFEHWKVIMPEKSLKKTYGNGAFHPKLYLFKFKTCLRVVISSANLNIGDWTCWSNCMYFCDFPRYTSLSQPKVTPSNDFKEQLKGFLSLIYKKSLEELDEFLGIRLDEFNFCFKEGNEDYREAIALPQLVDSVQGRYDRSNRKSGLWRLEEVSG